MVFFVLYCAVRILGVGVGRYCFSVVVVAIIERTFKWVPLLLFNYYGEAIRRRHCRVRGSPRAHCVCPSLCFINALCALCVLLFIFVVAAAAAASIQYGKCIPPMCRFSSILQQSEVG